MVGSSTRTHDAQRPAAFLGAPCCSSCAARSSSNSMPCRDQEGQTLLTTQPCSLTPAQLQVKRRMTWGLQGHCRLHESTLCSFSQCAGCVMT